VDKQPKNAGCHLTALNGVLSGFTIIWYKCIKWMLKWIVGSFNACKTWFNVSVGEKVIYLKKGGMISGSL